MKGGILSIEGFDTRTSRWYVIYKGQIRLEGVAYNLARGRTFKGRYIISHWVDILRRGWYVILKGFDTLQSKWYVILQRVDTLGRGSISSCKRGDLTKGDLIFQGGWHSYK